MSGLGFLNPWWLALAALVPCALWWRRKRGEPAVTFGPAALVVGLPRSFRARLAALPRWLEAAGVLAAVVALARPVQRVEVPADTEGIDILLCLDTSSSMAASDLDAGRTRLEVAKEAAARFIAGRPRDRIGLICFARYPDLRCPLTRDHAALAAILAGVTMVAADGPEDATGIGTAVALASKVLRPRESASKIAIVLTDGEENVATAQTPAEITPVHAAQLARELGVRVYAIAVGGVAGATAGGRPPPDTTQIRRMAERCDGAFFEARNADALDEIYRRIDALETSEAPATRLEIEERFLPFLIAAAALFLAGRILSMTVFEVLP